MHICPVNKDKQNNPKYLPHMKKITFILFALIAGTTLVQAQADGTATVNAEIVSPIEIANGTALNFGTINGTATGGDVTVDLVNGRSFTNTNMDITSATAITTAIFDITAAATYVYSIAIDDIFLTGAGADMAVTFYHNRNSTAGKTGSGAVQKLSVGGTLTVNDAQAAGSYDGTVKVTVAYE